MEDILSVIVKNLVDEPDEVKITRTEDAEGILLKVEVAKGDLGKVIGKQGRIAKAIRTVMKSITAKEHEKVSIMFDEEV